MLCSCWEYGTWLILRAYFGSLPIALANNLYSYGISLFVPAYSTFVTTNTDTQLCHLLVCSTFTFFWLQLADGVGGVVVFFAYSFARWRRRITRCESMCVCCVYIYVYIYRGHSKVYYCRSVFVTRGFCVSVLTVFFERKSI